MAGLGFRVKAAASGASLAEARASAALAVTGSISEGGGSAWRSGSEI